VLQRIVQGRSATLTHTFYIDGTPDDPTPDAATVTITRDDGTALITDAAATDEGEGVVSYTLTPADTADLDRLDVAWTAEFGGHEQVFHDTVEIAGGVLFTISQLRARGLQNATTYPTSMLVEMRTTVEDALESELGYALVPRYGKGTFPGSSSIRITPYLRTLRSASSDGTAYTPLSDLTISTSGFLTGRYWSSDVTVAYEHGLDEPPGRLVLAGLQLAKMWLTPSPVDDRASTFTSAEGGTYSLVTAGRGGSIFGHPVVDSAVMAERLVPVA
jgi:hypothetical protein